MQESRNGSFWFFLVLASLLGGAAVYFISAPFGLGLAADSIAYIQAAKHFLLGKGIFFVDNAANLAPMGNYPPVMPVVLSAAWFLGLSFVEWARLLNSFLFSGSIFLAGSIVYIQRGSRVPAWATVLVLMTSVQVLKAHVMMSAQPLFLFLLLAWVFLLFLFIDTGSRRALYGTAFCAGLSALTVYWGLALIIAGGLWLWLKGRVEGKIRDTALFLAASVILPSAWFVRNVMMTGSMTGDGMSLSRFPQVLYWAVLAVVAGLSYQWLKGRYQQGPGFNKIVLGVLIFYFVLASAWSVNMGIGFYKNGAGYSSKALGLSKLAETLRSIDDRVPLYSNDPAAVYYFAGRPAVGIDEQMAGGDVGFSMETMAADFAERRAVAVLFASPVIHSGEWEQASSRMGLDVLFKDSVGNILGVRKK